jgi:hypothetical protein
MVLGDNGPEVRALVAAGIPEYVEPVVLSPEHLRQIRAMTDHVDGLRSFSAEERKKMAENGQAMKDGSFPIANCDDAANAISSFGRAQPGQRASVRAHIRKRVAALGCTGSTFENWQ